MNINLLFFGQVAEITGKNAMPYPGIRSTDELMQKLIEMYPALQLINCSLAVNKIIVHQNTELNENDSVAILPPFSGG